MKSAALPLTSSARARPGARANYVRRYWPFVVPAAVIVLAVIIFPWVFTLFISVHQWDPSGGVTWVGWGNYLHLVTDARFGLAMIRTLYFSALSVALPLVLGIAAALCFHQRFPLRGLARTIFVLPMMATPVAVALVWTMMFHPQLGVLNYILNSIGLPPSEWTVQSEYGHPHLGDGRDLAMDAAGDADRARRYRQPPERSV